LFLFLFAGIMATFAGASGCRYDDEADDVSARGTVVYLSLEGGFYGIIGDDGQHWDPENLPGAYAIDSLRVSFRAVVTDQPTAHQWGRTVRLVSIKRIGSPPEVNLDPFKDLARAADCADVRNRLFLIDGHLVFWDRESTCKDAAYAQVLFGRTVERLICEAHDSIAGPVRACHDGGPYRAMFETMIENLDQPALGLGSGHTVSAIEF
jgi:hypothetical protein